MTVQFSLLEQASGGAERAAGGERSGESIQEQIRFSEEFHRVAFECSPLPMWICDLETLRFLNVNAAAIAQYGYSRAEFLEMSILAIRPPEMVEAARQAATLIRARGSASFPTVHQRRDGSLIEVEATANVFHWGGRTACMVVARDVTEQKRAAKELERQNELCRTVLENAPGGIVILNREGRILQWNRSFETLGQYAAEEIGSRHGLEFIDPADRAGVAERMERAFTEGKAQVEARFVTKDGASVWHFFHASRIQLEDEPCLLVVSLDVSAQKEADLALHRSEVLRGRVAEAALDAIFLVDARGCVVEANRAAERIFEWTKTELAGRAFSDLVPSILNERGALHARFPGAVTGRTPVLRMRMKMPARRKNGAIFPAEVSFSDVQADGESLTVAFLRDITESVTAASALEAARLRLKHVLSNSPAVIFSLREEAGRLSCAWVSENVLRLTGYTAEEALEEGWWERGVHREDLPRVRGAAPTFETTELRTLEYRFRCKDGREIWVQDQLKVLRGAGGDLGEIIGSWTDITEVKNLENQLRQAQKMEAIGTLAGGIAHDFNNILGVILGYAELTRMDSEDPAVQANLAEILNASRRAKELVNRILMFSRKQEPRRSLLRLDEVLTDAAKMLRATTPSSIELRVATSAGTAAIEADPCQIQQVLMNLAVNSIQAMGRQKGVLSLELGTTELGDTEAGALQLRAGGHAKLMVRDTGCGIAPENLSRIFDPFFTTKEPGSGTGLGLSVVHGIVKSHGGTIQVESEPGRGTVFTVYFPLAQRLDRARLEGEEADAAQGRGERILVIDDEEAIAEVTRLILVQAGYEAEAFSDPEAALRCFKEDPRRFHLAITDLSMPRRDGFEVARELLQARPDLPILLASGFVPQDEAGRARELGICGILPKPVGRRALLERVGAALAAGAGAG